MRKQHPCCFAPLADADLEEIALYIAADNPGRALTFVQEVQDHCLRIAENPEAYRLRDEYGPGTRVTSHGSYLIFHAVRGGALEIPGSTRRPARPAPDHRRPASWKACARGRVRDPVAAAFVTV